MRGQRTWAPTRREEVNAAQPLRCAAGSALPSLPRRSQRWPHRPGDQLLDVAETESEWSPRAGEFDDRKAALIRPLKSVAGFRESIAAASCTLRSRSGEAPLVLDLPFVGSSIAPPALARVPPRPSGPSSALHLP